MNIWKRNFRKQWHHEVEFNGHRFRKNSVFGDWFHRKNGKKLLRFQKKNGTCGRRLNLKSLYLFCLTAHSDWLIKFAPLSRLKAFWVAYAVDGNADVFLWRRKSTAGNTVAFAGCRSAEAQQPTANIAQHTEVVQERPCRNLKLKLEFSLTTWNKT